MTNLIYLPGFNSGPQSEKSILLKQVFPELVVPVYDTWHPQRAFKQLDRLLEPILQQRPVLIGSSLGGFWAYQFAARHALRCVLLNPCMTPEISLKCAVGRVQHFYTQEVGELSLADLEQYAHYRSIPHAEIRAMCQQS